VVAIAQNPPNITSDFSAAAVIIESRGGKHSKYLLVLIGIFGNNGNLHIKDADLLRLLNYQNSCII
jgi:hypothetical protein